MKKVLLFAGLSLMMAVFSCKKKNDIPEPTPIPVVDEKEIEVTGDIATTTWKADKKYILKGTCFVQAGQVLTIEPGTIIVGNKASKGTLVINEGGKLVAEGTADKPIVFTSQLEKGARDAGDWGGLVILGKANCNQNRPAIEGISPAVNYGTQNSTANDGESSGTLKYVRVEYAGIALSPNNETNSITFGSVGSGTVLENVQVSYGGDDGFEWFGGTCNGKNLVSYGTWDDDMDCDFGFTGKVQFAVIVRDPFAADQSGSNAFEIDNDASGTGSLPLTACKFSNVTVFGPIGDSLKGISGNYQHMMHLRRNSKPSIYNSVLAGFPRGLNLDGSGTEGHFNSDAAQLKNNILISLPYDKTRSSSAYFEATGSTNDRDYWTKAENNNTTLTTWSSLGTVGLSSSLFHVNNATYPSNPNFAVTSGTAASGASFTGLDSYFQAVSYRGAFGSTDWTDGWAEFNPQNKDY
jgi:hypothetical protein